MSESVQEFGFTYFSSPEYYVSNKFKTWMDAVRKLGANTIVIQANFSTAIPEDVFLCAKENQLNPVVHFVSELPLARKFNEVAFLLDVYAKWGVSEVILGDLPNMKSAWPTAGWHYENLVDHFLDRFIPLATHAVRLGLVPIAPPLKPGGDYWDTAFMELFISGLKRRQLSEVLDRLILASYGFTFDKSLSWGRGGPEQWLVTQPYQHTEGQQDQLGFNHFEWMQAIGTKVTGKTFQAIILDAGNPGIHYNQTDPGKIFEDIRQIMRLCKGRGSASEEDVIAPTAFDEKTRFCTFSLDTIDAIMTKPFEPQHLLRLFEHPLDAKSGSIDSSERVKPIKHYLLLPSHHSGVSDAILNKVRPIIKAYQPTIGFSLSEAAMAEKVSVYPDANKFSDEAINQLRTSGCVVQILPKSGIEIATSLQAN